MQIGVLRFLWYCAFGAAGGIGVGLLKGRVDDLTFVALGIGYAFLLKIVFERLWPVFLGYMRPDDTSNNHVD